MFLPLRRWADTAVAISRAAMVPHGVTASKALVLLALPCYAIWPFGNEPEPQEQPGNIDGMPPFMMPMMGGPMIGGPVIVMEGHFGFDPWEDLHSNVRRVIHQNAQGRELLPAPDGNDNMAVAKPLEMQIGNLLDIFGDHHSGHVGRAQSSFHVDDDHHSRFRVSASLPGYKLGSQDLSQSPLSVRVVGRRSLVVNGKQQMGHMITSWQRSFSLPKGSDIDKVSVTYNAASGNLTVDVPRKNTTSGDANAEQEEEMDENDDMDDFLPPALRAMREGLPGVLNHMNGLQPRGQGHFLKPSMGLPNMLDEVFNMVGQLHPRMQLPAEGQKPVPEDAEVNLIGCFAESQLAKTDMKYYGDSNAVSFAAMFWHASADHTPFFAMSRHGAPLGHAFTFRSFAHEIEKPQWGTYDGCGAPCEDDHSRWCGCSNEASRGFPNGVCEEDQKRFAVYKVGNMVNISMSQGGKVEESKHEENKHEQDKPVSTEALKGRPHWQLVNGDNAGSSPEIEIIVPKGTVAKPQGRQLLFYNASDVDASQAATPVDQGDPTKNAAGGPADQNIGAANGSTKSEPVAPNGQSEVQIAQNPSEVKHDAAATAFPAGAAVGPVGKMRLPVDVSPESCAWEPGRPGNEGSQIIKCKIEESDVKQVPIKVIDEL